MDFPPPSALRCAPPTGCYTATPSEPPINEPRVYHAEARPDSLGSYLAHGDEQYWVQRHAAAYSEMVRRQDVAGRTFLRTGEKAKSAGLPQQPAASASPTASAGVGSSGITIFADSPREERRHDQVGGSRRADVQRLKAEQSCMYARHEEPGEHCGGHSAPSAGAATYLKRTAPSGISGAWAKALHRDEQDEQRAPPPMKPSVRPRPSSGLVAVHVSRKIASITRS